MAAGEPTINEEWVTFATDGQHKFLETIKMPMLDTTGTIIGVLGVGRDITRRKQTEIKLLESEEKFKSIFEGSNDAIMLLNKDGIFDCNKRTLEIFKVNCKEDLFGLHPLGFSPLKQANGRLSAEIANEIINASHQPDKQFDWIFTRTNGEMFPAKIHFSTFTSRGENVQQFTIRDITTIEQELIIANQELILQNAEKEARAAELIVAKEKAEESDHLKSAFLATMNHELRTPLNHILGFSEIINSSAEDDDIKEWANIIVESGTGLLNIIEDIFDLAIAEQGQIKIRKQSFKGIDIFLENRKALDEIIVSAGKENEIKLVYKPDSTLLQTFLIADRSKINQVLINLFKNASKFTRKGAIEFGFYQKDENEIVFYVKDTGVGIQADKMDVIFEFFRQLDDSNTRYYGGVGIGLAISKRIAEAMNARIVVESEVGKGTTFFLYVPVEITSLVLPTHESDEDVTLPDLTGKTILIAEDDAISRRLVKMLLETTHANLVEAENGQEAIEKMVEFQDIDLILMDLKMPVLDGYKATTQIKAIWPDIKIIALTAYSIVKEKKLALSAGCDDIIIKPIDKRILFAKLKQFYPG
jgi:PAS domain S-box-containing protein